MHPYGGGPGVGLYDRPYQLARSWQKLGHSATVFIAANHHLLEKDFRPPREFAVDGVQYAAVPCRPYASNGIGRLVNMWEFSRNLDPFGMGLVNKAAAPDAIVVSSPHPFPIFAARALAKRFSAKLVFEIRDIWPLSAVAIAGMSKWHPFVQLCAVTERFALQKSNLIASVLPRVDQYLAIRGYDKPFVWVPNGIGRGSGATAVETPEAKSAAQVLAQWRTEGRKVVVHAGTIGQHNAIDLLVEAIAFGHSAGQADNFRLLLLGVGEQMAALQRAAEAGGAPPRSLRRAR